jgi:hypothetical protein
MAEDLLVELETAAPVAQSLANIADLKREAMRQAVQVRLAAEGMKGSVRTFENIWQRMVLAVAKGQTEQMQAGRARLLSALEKRLGELKDTHVLAVWLRELGSAEIPDPDMLLPEVAGLERLKANVFDRWQSAEDLERLAVEHYPLTQAQLEQVAARHPPPPEWYEGEEERLFEE